MALVHCEKCSTTYDDKDRWTICPHGPLYAAAAAYCREHDLAPCPYPPERHYWRIRTVDDLDRPVQVEHVAGYRCENCDEVIPGPLNHDAMLAHVCARRKESGADVERPARYWWSGVLDVLRKFFRRGA